MKVDAPITFCFAIFITIIAAPFLVSMPISRQIDFISSGISIVTIVQAQPGLYLTVKLLFNRNLEVKRRCFYSATCFILLACVVPFAFSLSMRNALSSGL